MHTNDINEALLVFLDSRKRTIDSDIDLSNISEGVVYNCEFVQKYLENLPSFHVIE